MSVYPIHIKSARSGGLNKLDRGIAAAHARPGGGDPLGEHAVAAAEVEHVLAGPGGEQFDHGRTQVGDKAGVALVCNRVPSLPGR